MNHFCLALGCFVIVGCITPAMNTRNREPPLVKIALGQAIDDIVGHSWPVLNGTPMELTAIETARSLCVVFPSGRTWNTYSRVTCLSQKGGTVSALDISPMNTPQGFAAALNLVKLAAEELGIANERVIASKLDEWSAHPQAWSPFATYSTGCPLEPGVTVFIEIKPASKVADWYITYSFTDDRFFIDGSGVPVSGATGL